MSRQTYDVVIVGARCAGSAAAIWLARQGLRVLVLDRGARGSDTGSTHALMRGGVLQLQKLGVLDNVIAAGTPAVRRAVFHYPEDTTRITVKPAAGVDALYAARRTVLDRILADGAQAAGADVRFGMTVTGLLFDEARRVTGVTARDRDGQRLTVPARFTVGADGTGSMVARAVEAPVTWKATSPGSAFLYGHWEGLPTDGYEWFYAPMGSAGLIPTNHGQTCVFLGAPPERMKAARADGTFPAVRTLLGGLPDGLRQRVEDARAPKRLRGFSGISSHLRRPWGPGWVLAGDAGGFQDPLSTHGMTDALRDATLVAEAIMAVHAGAASEAEAFAEFGTRRDSLALPLLKAIDSISSYRWTMGELRRLLMEASSAMSQQVETLHSLGHSGAPSSLSA